MIDPATINLPNFIANWYGNPDLPRESLPEQHAWIPAPLRTWHEISRQWSTPLVTLKKMISPEEIEARDGKAIFMIDPGDSAWAFDMNDPNIVYEGQLYEGWVASSESMTEFLKHNLLNEAAFNAPATRFSEAVNFEALERTLEPMTEVSFGGWLWPQPGHRIYMNSVMVADVGPSIEESEPFGNREGLASVQIGSISPKNLEYLDAIHQVEWFV
ncbi:hypothetical protein [Streptomyces sp. NPDC020330]|uniref:hypothetical protein n=1 Tax=unclassified Streptomyces TaxID=2593676 RepID=UPI0037A9C039